MKQISRKKYFLNGKNIAITVFLCGIMWGCNESKQQTTGVSSSSATVVASPTTGPTNTLTHAPMPLMSPPLEDLKTLNAQEFEKIAEINKAMEQSINDLEAEHQSASAATKFLTKLKGINLGPLFETSMGFVYDKEQDIYVTKIDTWQRKFGYSRAYDTFSMFIGFVYEFEEIKFDYKGKSHKIELWKGQYLSKTGAEVGFYEKTRPPIEWKCVDDDMMLEISYSLRKNGEEIFHRKGTHWWLTGFKPGVFSLPEELTIKDLNIKFKDKDIRDAFLTSLYKLGYDNAKDNIRIAENSVTFDFVKPKTKQIWPKQVLAAAEAYNRNLTNVYNSYKKLTGKTDNSPGTIESLIERTRNIERAKP